MVIAHRVDRGSDLQNADNERVGDSSLAEAARYELRSGKERTFFHPSLTKSMEE